ncbi:MAG: EutP/PduV family microcompartment system protein [Cellulosilyticaceae bacterium]
MSKIIFIGKTGSGKTTLCQKLNELELKYKKTQSIEVYDNAIDTPGEYIENRGLYSALIVTAADAEVIGLVNDCTEEESYLPPAFASTFCKEVIGIITKINKADNPKKIQRAFDNLQNAGVSKIFKVDTVDGDGVMDLLEYLSEFQLR